MHILFLSDNFPPEVNAPASRTYEHCREWVKAGHKVTVITCAPNHPKGKVFLGYRNRLWQTETVEGIRVVRVWTYIAANQGVVRRILDYLSFMLSAILVSPFLGRQDIVVATSPQFFSACAGYVASRLVRAPFVFELRDLWPESIEAVGVLKISFPLRVIGMIEAFLYRKAAAIVSVTNSFRQVLINRGIDGDKIHVVTNGADLAFFQPAPCDKALKTALRCDGKFIAGYIGTHGLAHSLQTLLYTAMQLADRPDGRDIVILLVGDGAAKKAMMASALTMGLSNVRFVDSVNKVEVRRYWSVLDTSVIHLSRTELFKSVIPSKLFESMAMGVPIVHGVEGESAEIVQATGAGFCFEPENAEALADLLVALSNDRAALDAASARCREGARRYNRLALASDMLRILQSTARAENEKGRTPVPEWRPHRLPGSEPPPLG